MRVIFLGFSIRYDIMVRFLINIEKKERRRRADISRVKRFFFVEFIFFKCLINWE